MINPLTGKLYSKNYGKLNLSSIPLNQPDVVKQLEELFLEADVLILEAETGAGKSVMAPVHIARIAGPSKKIAMSEPRTVNAVNIATTLGKLFDDEVGGYVGFMTGEKVKMSKRTKFTVMTDALMFQRLLSDPEEFDVVLIDEFHERNVNIDMCLAIIKRYYKAIKDAREFEEWRTLQRKKTIKERLENYDEEREYIEKYRENIGSIPKRLKNPTKFVLLSATIDPKKYLHYYKDCNVKHMFVKGRSFPVEDVFLDDLGIVDVNPETMYIVLDKIIREYPLGDVIVFLPGKKEILDAITTVKPKYGDQYMIGGVYRGSPDTEGIIKATKFVELGFEGRIIFATNIAETGITIDGLKYVIETGTEKKITAEKDYNELASQMISFASAKQRCGRVGRSSPGTCFHLYNKDDLAGFKKQTLPAIYSENLMNLLLSLMNVINNVDELIMFLTRDLPDPLDKSDIDLVIYRFYKDLVVSGNLITFRGSFMASLAMDYYLSALVLKSFEYNIETLMVPIVAVYSIGNFSDFFTDSRAIVGYRNRYGEPYAIAMFYINIAEELTKKDKLKNYCTENKLNYDNVSQIQSTIDGIVKKINAFAKERKEITEKFIKETGLIYSPKMWKNPIEDFEGETLETYGKLISAVFYSVYRNYAIYIPYERSYRTLSDIKIDLQGIGPLIDISHRPSMIGYSQILKLGSGGFILSTPYVVIDKSD